MTLEEALQRAANSDDKVLPLTTAEFESLLASDAFSMENREVGLWQGAVHIPGHPASGCTGIGNKPIVLVKEIL